MTIFAAYIEGLPTPIASGETKSACFLEALKVLEESRNDPIIGHTAKLILDSGMSSRHPGKLTITPFVPA